MTRDLRHRCVGPLAAVALALGACGGSGAEEPPPATDLTIRVTGAGGDPVSISLRCQAGAPCEQRRVEPVRAALDRSADAARVCAEIYGGPERARVTGTLGGRRVDAEVARTDACGIADYEALFEALGRRPPLAR